MMTMMLLLGVLAAVIGAMIAVGALALNYFDVIDTRKCSRVYTAGFLLVVVGVFIIVALNNGGLM